MRAAKSCTSGSTRRRRLRRCPQPLSARRHPAPRHEDSAGEASTLDGLGLIKHHIGHCTGAVHTISRSPSPNPRARQRTPDHLRHTYAILGQHTQAPTRGRKFWRYIGSQAAMLTPNASNGESTNSKTRTLPLTLATEQLRLCCVPACTPATAAPPSTSTCSSTDRSGPRLKRVTIEAGRSSRAVRCRLRRRPRSRPEAR